jgi:hypothetical protein
MLVAPGLQVPDLWIPRTLVTHPVGAHKRRARLRCFPSARALLLAEIQTPVFPVHALRHLAGSGAVRHTGADRTEAVERLLAHAERVPPEAISQQGVAGQRLRPGGPCGWPAGDNSWKRAGLRHRPRP